MLTESEIAELIERLLRTTGRRVDLSSPFVDAALPDGSRLHIVLPDITRSHPAINIRKFIARTRSLHDLVESGSLTPAAAGFLDAAVVAGANILVTGQTPADKTTMLNALCGSVPARERVITCEEVSELSVPARDWIAMQCRQPSLEGTLTHCQSPREAERWKSVFPRWRGKRATSREACSCSWICWRKKRNCLLIDDVNRYDIGNAIAGAKTRLARHPRLTVPRSLESKQIRNS